MIMNKLKKEYPFVSVIIPTWRESRILKQCLNSLITQDYPKNKFEIILVSKENPNIENFETKGIKISLILGDFNCAQARNEATKIAQGEIFAFVDDDCVSPKEWILRAVKFFDKEEVGLIGGPALPFEKEPFRYRLGGYLSKSFFVGGFLSNRYKILPSVHESNNYDLILANNFVKKSVFEKVRGFNKDQVPSEDYDLYYRVKRAGYKLLYVPEIFVWHRSKPIFLPWAEKIFYYATGRGVLMARNPKIIKPIFFLPSFFVMIFIGLFVISLFFKIFFYLWLGFISLYILWNIINAFYIFFKFEKNPLVLLLSLPATFLIHCSYGLGILFGFYKFISGGYKKGIKTKSKY